MKVMVTLRELEDWQPIDDGKTYTAESDDPREVAEMLMKWVRGQVMKDESDVPPMDLWGEPE